jgi:hypothetical protein
MKGIDMPKRFSINSVNRYLSMCLALRVLLLAGFAESLNASGGGVITIIPQSSVSVIDPGYVQVQLAPPAVVAAGAGWKLQGDSTYSSAPSYTRIVTTTNDVTVQFAPVPGWNLPTNQTVNLVADEINVYSASYSVTNPVLVADAALGLGITGTTNTVYEIESQTSLTNTNWIPVSTNTIITNGFNLVLPNPETNGATIFYKAVWLGQ